MARKITSSFDWSLQDQHELVAADAADGVALAQHRAQPLAHALQQLVAGRVAERVVDELEVVEVHEHHGDVRAASAASTPPGAGGRAAGCGSAAR
jgi:hypothetical protein